MLKAVRAVTLLSVASGTGLERALAWAAGPDDLPFSRPLRLPPVLTGDHITLVARKASVPIKPGPATQMWTFNGHFPGPTIRRPSGRRTRVTVVHDLGAAADSLTIHLHGAHTPSNDDGQPNRFVIPPRGRRTYHYGFREDGAPERGALKWYHDHSHHRTLANVWHGLAGLLILEDGLDVSLGLPAGRFDIPLFITDRVFDLNNQLIDPLPATSSAPGDDIRVGEVLVNGGLAPYLFVEPRRYRFRVLSAGVFRPYNLALSNGAAMSQVGADGGLLPAALRRTSILLGPAERADIVIDFSKFRGQKITLNSEPVKNTVPIATPAIESPLIQFRVGAKPARDNSRVPATLRRLPTWVSALSPAPQRVWLFGAGVDPMGGTAWTINGLAFDPDRVDARPVLGSLETWLLINIGPAPTSHYIHMHDVPFKVLQRNGQAATGDETGLKDTFRLDPGEVLLLGSKFSDHLGRYMMHCHMLAHEDHGMMTTFEVVKEGPIPAPATPAALLARTVQEPGHRACATQVLAQVRSGRPAPRDLLRRINVVVSPPGWLCS